MKNFKSTSALFMLLLVPCSVFGGVSDFASSIASLPGKAVRSVLSTTKNTVDGVADIELNIVETVLNPIVTYKKALSRMASLITLGGAGYYLQKAYKNNCPFSCTKSCNK